MRILFLTLWSVLLFSVTPAKSGPNALVVSPSRPVSLQLHISSNDTGVIKIPRTECRTKPLFFEETLGIKRGQSLSFDVDRWQAIQRCGLFKNLTAKAFANNAGEVTLHVIGEEIPSIRFSPEVSVAASIDKPEASGGVVFSDRNFRGLGQRFDFQVAKKEGKEIGTDALQPTITVKWSDNTIGKTTSISVGFDDESTLQDAADLVPSSRLNHRYQSGTKTLSHRLNTNVKRFFVRFRDFDFLNFARNHARKQHPASSLGCMMELDLEPYIESSMASSGRALLQGAKVSAVSKWRSGLMTTLTHDGGIGTYGWGHAPYHQMTAEMTTPVMNLLGEFQGRLISAPITATTNVFGGEWFKNALQLTCKLRAKAMHSWGPACLPLVHGLALGDAQLVRSYGDHSDERLVDILGPHRRRVTSFASLKTDVYIEGLNTLKPGGFADLAFFRAPTIVQLPATSSLFGGSFNKAKNAVVQRWERAAGLGLSLRGFGFRMDVAWPLKAPISSSSMTSPAPVIATKTGLGTWLKWGSGGSIDTSSVTRPGGAAPSMNNSPRIHLGVDIGA